MASTKFAVCPECEGRGTIVNPAIDGNGLSAEDFDEQGEDFREDYFAGVYDVRCPECGGNRVVPVCGASRRVGHEVVICTEAIEPGTWEDDEGETLAYSACYQHMDDAERESVDDAARYAAEVAAEIRMGA